MSTARLSPRKVAAISLWTIAWRSLNFFVRAHTAIALGIAAATAVIVGALVVGDSVRGSLRQLVENRLGRVECLLHSRTFFETDLVHSLALDASLPGAAVSPVILFSSATVERRSEDFVTTRASRVQILAVGTEFWPAIGIDGDIPRLGTDQIALNRALAVELGVAVGDEVTLLVNDLTGVPGDNPLGRREDNAINVPRQKVAVILPDNGVGGISFLSSQSVPRNVFASLATLQDVLEIGNKANGALVFGDPTRQNQAVSGQGLCDELNLQLRPKLEDYGLQLHHHRRVFPDSQIDVDDPAVRGLPPQIVSDYFQLSSTELILDDATSSAVVAKLGSENATRLLTYLANSIGKVTPSGNDLMISRSAAGLDFDNVRILPTELRGGLRFEITESGDGPRRRGRVSQTEFLTDHAEPSGDKNQVLSLLSREVPYSIVVGVDASSELNLRQYTSVPREQLGFPYCWINSWLAEQIDASPGNWIQLKYFEPETVDGKETEVSKRFMVAGIVPLTAPETSYQRSKAAAYRQPPTIFNDPNLTPNVPGVTDQDSISQWDLPFKLKHEIPPVDDAYWNDHRLTPKVFTPYHHVAKSDVFASRFGNTTAIRIPLSKISDENVVRIAIEDALLETRSLKGLAFQPTRERQLHAASGTTPFDMLFMSLSFFVIVAALILVALLFRLGIQQRSSELGILSAQGFTPSQIKQLLLRELLFVALIGALLGIPLGLGYARAMIAGLESWWIGAISTRFLSFFATPQSMLLGATAGFLTSLLAIYLGLRQMSKLDPLPLLRGRGTESSDASRRIHQLSLAVAGFAAFGACGLIVAGLGQTGMSRAGSFFGSGMLLLTAAIIAVRQIIANGTSRKHDSPGGSLWYMGWKSICRNPMRSTLSLGLLAVAAFLIASMSVFQIAPSKRGYGGFDLLAESSLPLYRNIGSQSVRAEILGDDAKLLADSTIVPMRAKNGEDASCNNLFQVEQPTILGLNSRLREIHDFSPESMQFDWSAPRNENNPWQALVQSGTNGLEANPIPVILDQNTAAWSLKQGAALDSIIQLKINNRNVFFKTVGLLSNSVLQGKLLIDEQNFEHLFPEVSGYSFFMIRSGKTQEPQVVAQTLEKGWSNEGLDVTYSRDALARFLGVQNTYISAFQSLGALGLLLGTFGLIAVQLRSVLERRREFALMRAVGFAPERIGRLLSIETAILLGGGLSTGVLCAAISLAPYLIEQGPQLTLLTPLLMLAAVLAAGFLAAYLAVRAALRQPVLAGLRSE